ncbi:LAG1 longevity assurance homolog 3 [Striga asiatica]|uniref:LAG1 longevity assurance homolog 3 n=1 Tax=Striga asiatica TaxID=4170 RepID=A0A5A7QZB9_STRAF|nr:LAG1 longevity assurance homolog 3 [Striga asiatica]
MGFRVLMNSIDWEQESYPKYEDFVALSFFALFFPTVRFLLDRFIFEKVGRRLLYGTCTQLVKNETDEQKKKMRKFKESAWKCIYYLSAEIFALAVTFNEPWFRNTKYFWVGPGDQAWPDQTYKLKLKGLYMFAGGFYIYSIFALIFWETRRSDFGVSMGHHVATFILIVLSYVFSYEVIQYLDKEKHKIDGPIYYYVFNFLLFSLLVLHVYWWVLMYRMLVKQIQARGHVSEDVRSDSEDEDEHED